MINIFIKSPKFGKVYYADLTEDDLENINTFILSMGIKPVKDRIYSQVPFNVSKKALNAISKGLNVYPVTFEVLTQHSHKEISAIKGVGSKALESIDTQLKLAGLSFKED